MLSYICLITNSKNHFSVCRVDFSVEAKELNQDKYALYTLHI